MSHQADLMEESLEKSCEQVDFIFKTFEEQSNLQHGRDKGKNKRNWSSSVSSTRSTASNTMSRWNKKRQRTKIHVLDEDLMSRTGGSLSHSDDEDEGMGLDNVQEEEEIDLSELEREDEESFSSDESMAQQESTAKRGSSQGESSRKE